MSLIIYGENLIAKASSPKRRLRRLYFALPAATTYLQGAALSIAACAEFHAKLLFFRHLGNRGERLSLCRRRIWDGPQPFIRTRCASKK
jgi:hypothetical protein